MIMEEKKKSRKRKIANRESLDGAESKLLKADEDLYQGTGNDDEDQKEADEAEEALREEALPTATKPFNAKKFRACVKSGDCILNIRYFLQDALENPSIVAQYINVGGRPLEFSQTLNKIDKSELFHISYVFRGIYLILIEILNSSKDITKEKESVEACAYILNNHRSSIEKLLNSNVLSHKKAALKLLTAMVYLAPHLGRELLTSFNAVFNSESLMRFTSHDKVECHLEDEDHVRTCYIHFILAYIIEGNQTLVKNLLDRTELVMAVVSGLVYDSSKTVCLVLNSFQKFVLKSDSVSKTKKVHVFNQNVIKEMLKLFDWKGPEYFRATFNKKLRPTADQLVKSDELSAVTSVLYEFLKELLTSRKHGIAFKCLGHRQSKYNTTQKKVILWLDNFWEHAEKGDLIIDILKACPELTKHFIQKHASRLDPNKKMNNWQLFIEYFTRVIDSLSPDIIQYHANDMNSKEIIELIKEISMAPEILQQMRGKHTLKSDSLMIRQKSTNLLCLMLKQCNQYLVSLARWNICSANDLKKIKFNLINHVLLLYPSVENILLSLHMTQMDDNADSEEVLKHLESILDLLLIITSSIPSFIDTTSSVINYIKILGPLYECNRDSSSSTRIELKAVKLMLALEPKALSPKTDLFDQVLQSFFNVFRYGTNIEKKDAKLLLRNVFQNTGFFENGVLEVDLWLEALNYVPEEDLSDVKDFIINAFNNYNVGERNFKRMFTASDESKESISKIFSRIELGDTQEGVLDVPKFGIFFQYVVANLDQNQAVNRYIQNVSYYLYYFLSKSEPLLSVLEKLNNTDMAYVKAFNNITKKGKPADDLKPEVTKDFVSALYQSNVPFLEALKDFAVRLESKSSISTSPTIDDKIYDFNNVFDDESRIMLFVYIATHVVNAQQEKGKFTEEQCRQVLDYLQYFISILKELNATSYDGGVSGFNVRNLENDCVAKFLRYLYGSCISFLQHFDVWDNENQVTVLIQGVTKFVKDVDYLPTILVHYRKKIVKQILSAIAEAKDADGTSKNAVCRTLPELLDLFQLDYDECSAILGKLSELNYKQFVTKENDQSIFAIIWSYALAKVTQLKSKPLENEIVRQLSCLYVDLVTNTIVEINFENIESAWHAYLSTFGQSISHTDGRLFEAIFESKVLNKSTVRLGCLLLQRNPSLTETFMRLLPLHPAKKELIYPLINVIAQAKLNIEQSLLTTLYSGFKNGITKAIEKPQKAALIYKENIISSVYLIEKCMPLKECVDFVNKAVKFESAEVFQLQIVKSIYLKVLMGTDKPDEIRTCYQNFIAVFIQLFVFLLKKETLDYNQVNSFASVAFEWIQLKRKYLPDNLQPIINYESIHGKPIWQQFGKLCMKNALSVDFDPATKKIDDSPAVLLKLFGFFCDEFYKNGQNHDDAKTFFEMATTHHAFFDVCVLQQKSEIKTYLMYLIYVLILKDARSLEASHLPVFLSGYQAKMSHCDRYILAILQLYEKNGVDIHKYRPFIWGESALSHYSLTDTAAIKTTLFQEPPMMQVMTLIERELSDNTLVNFPLWRRLNVIEQVPDVEFVYHGIAGDERTDEVLIAKSNIEKLLESRSEKVDPEVLLSAAHRDETYEQVYDPAFMVPLMQMAFATETVTKPVRPAQNGLLSIIFASLSSTDKDMRMAASTALQRYRNHMDTARFADSKLWFHMFESIQNGLAHFSSTARKPKKNRCPRVPYISGLFFARLINTLQTPLSEMYRPLSTFLLIKNSINFLSVPEFNVLFHSPDVNHHIHRIFILDTIRDGMKTSSDFSALVATDIFKALLGFYGTPMSNRETDYHILTVVNAALKIPKSAKTMIESVGVLPWLNTLIDNVEFFQFDFIDLLCTAISNLYYSVKINQSDYRKSSLFDLDCRFFNLLLKLCPKLSSHITEMPFLRYINILNKVSVSTTIATTDQFVSEAIIDHLLKCATGYLSEGVIVDLEFIRNDPHMYYEPNTVFVRKLREDGLNESSVFLASKLREITISARLNLINAV